MPEEKVIKRAQQDKEEGKSPSTQAGEFVRDEMHHIREGKHGARSAQQAIAIGLSKARRAGVGLPPPKQGVSSKTRAQARRETQKAKESPTHKPSTVRSRATTSGALKREGRSAAQKCAYRDMPERQLASGAANLGVTPPRKQFKPRGK